MDAEHGHFQVGVRVILWNCAVMNKTNQQWVMDDGRLRLKNSAKHLCVDTENPEQLVLQLCQQERKKYQQFQINIATNKITNADNNKQCVQMSSEFSSPRTLKLAKCVETEDDGFDSFNNQLFKFFLPVTQPQKCKISSHLLEVLENSNSRITVDEWKSKWKVSEEQRRAAIKDVRSCQSAVKLKNNQRVKGSSASSIAGAIKLFDDTAGDEEMHRPATSSDSRKPVNSISSIAGANEFP